MNLATFKLSEGLYYKSLRHLILPVISIDEYESKISDKRAIVVGFFVSDQEPADDLCSFIERSSVPIFDTEVSPSPTPEGFFVTWVELQRNNQFPKLVQDLVKDIENLCEITNWQFTSPKNKEPLDLNTENLTRLLLLDHKNVLEIPSGKGDLSEEINFWKNAEVDQFSFDNKKVILEKNNMKYAFMVKKPNKHLAINIAESSSALQSLLGSRYAVYSTSDGYLVEHNGKRRHLIFVS